MGGGDTEAEEKRKEEQKAKKKKRKPRDNEAASTDIADVTTLSDEEADKLEEDSRKDRAKGLPKDVTGRIISMSVVGDKTKILIGARVKGMQGVEGYIRRGDGMLARFRIGLWDHRTAFAFVDLTPDQLSPYAENVIINPSSMPAKSERRKDIATRVVNIDIVGGRTRIMIGRGSSHGVRDRMSGYIHAEGGKPYESFVLSKVSSLHSEAFVDATLDQVHRNMSVMVNPSM